MSDASASASEAEASSEEEVASESEELESSSSEEDGSGSDEEAAAPKRGKAPAKKAAPAAPRRAAPAPVARPAALAPRPALAAPRPAFAPVPARLPAFAATAPAAVARAAPPAPSAAFARRAAPAPAKDADDAPESDADDSDDASDGGSSSSSEAFEVPEDDEDDNPGAQFKINESRKEANTRAMLSGALVVKRVAMTRLLPAPPAEVLRRQFKCPAGGVGPSDELRRRLALRQVFVPWGQAGGMDALRRAALPVPAAEAPQDVLPPGIEPLQLWPLADDAPPPDAKPILVDNMLTRWLRPHQRAGVQFMFECVMGLRGFQGSGCILADDMGLGKTLQAIALLWTLLRQGTDGQPVAKRVIIVCPTSLVSNWDSECEKWLKGRVRTTPLAESTRSDVISSVTQFLSPRTQTQVLIVSYETFRLHAERFSSPSACDLLICDEAHRLKNDETLTNKALDSLTCRRRVLLSGTPIQNHLDEFYAMVNFANPGLLGTNAEFRKKYERPILAGREPGASDLQQTRGAERAAELSAAVDPFILRRTNALLSEHLPPKVIQIVCCPLTTMQECIYYHFLESKEAKRVLNGKQSKVLPAINALKKLCNHPKLIYDMLAHTTEAAADGFKGCDQFFDPGVFDDGRVGRGLPSPGWEMHGGKFIVLARLLDYLKAHTTDRIVLVSNYTQTLDLFQAFCRERRYPALRLDGSVTISKRQVLVKQFNDLEQNQFAFLLSSKAGGCGLNLIGGNRLVLFDPDWNPANDKQAAGRVWRDGQKKRVFVYRFLSSGTIEEKVYQRQLSKEGLQNLVDAKGKIDTAMLPKDELRKLFELRKCTSDTHDSLDCTRCPKKIAEPDSDNPEQVPADAAPACPWQHQHGHPAEDDLAAWGHHTGADTVPDEALRFAGADKRVSFVFVCKVDGKDVEDEPPPPVALGMAGSAAGGAAGGPLRLNAGAPRAPLSSMQSKVPAAGASGRPAPPRQLPFNAPKAPGAAGGPGPAAPRPSGLVSGGPAKPVAAAPPAAAVAPMAVYVPEPVPFVMPTAAPATAIETAALPRQTQAATTGATFKRKLASPPSAPKMVPLAALPRPVPAPSDSSPDSRADDRPPGFASPAAAAAAAGGSGPNKSMKTNDIKIVRYDNDDSDFDDERV